MQRERSWMYKRNLPERRGLIDEFMSGLKEFLNFASSNVEFMDGNQIRCPCRKCHNGRFLPSSKVSEHLCRFGFTINYYNWTCHGEPFIFDEDYHRYNTQVSRDQSYYNQLNPYQRMIFDVTGSNLIPQSQGATSSCPPTVEVVLQQLSSISEDDTFVRTFQKKDKIWSGDRARAIKERYDQLSLSQRISGDDDDNEGSEPSVSNNLDLWLEASGGAKGGRILGMGSMSRIHNVPRRSLSSTPPAVTAQIHNLTEEVSNLKGIIFERDQQILEIQQQNSQRDQEMIEMRRQQAFLMRQFQQFSSGPSQIPPGNEDDGGDDDDID